MTTRFNMANAKRLHELGIQFCLMHLKCKRHGQRVYMPDGNEIQVHTQNTMGEAFTIHVTGKDDFSAKLQRSAHVFVNYGESGNVSAHFLDKPTHDTYSMTSVGRDSIALVFDESKCQQLISLADRDLWLQFRKYSAARKFNLNSPHYAAA
jgi:hypothetical protein